MPPMNLTRNPLIVERFGKQQYIIVELKLGFPIGTLSLGLTQSQDFPRKVLVA